MKKAGKCSLVKHYEIQYGKAIQDAARLIKKTGARHVYVTKKKIPMGVISTVDIVNDVVAAGKSAKKTKVEEIMKKPIFACSYDDTVADCYFKLAKHNIIVIPVLRKNKIEGLLTSQEIMKELVKKGSKK